MVVRRNILRNATARNNYIRGVILLKNEFPGPTTGDFNIPGPSQPISTYDLFVCWHNIAMNTFTPPTQFDRNAAHRGPSFLPWHRFMLLQLEMNLQRVLNDVTFGLPYWDWAKDGGLPLAQQKTAPIWGVTCMGGQGQPITTGPFAFDASDPNSWRVKIEEDGNGQLKQTNRGLGRQFGLPIAPPNQLPTKKHVAAALSQVEFDSEPWNATSTGFRNLVEGWQRHPNVLPPSLHNRVHVFVGGDMLPSTSPNDPVFFLNHCNVDRIWEAWMRPQPQGHGRSYAPPSSAPIALRGHRLNDTLSSLLSGTTTPAKMLNVSAFYKYDSLNV
jgi:tyrosinase